MSSIKAAAAMSRPNGTAVIAGYMVPQDGKLSVSLVSTISTKARPCSRMHQSGCLGNADAT